MDAGLEIRPLSPDDADALIRLRKEALESHLMCFAAEDSRTHNGAVIEMDAYRQEADVLAAAT